MSRSHLAIAVGSAGTATGLGVLRALAKWKRPPQLLACDTNPAHLVAAATEFNFQQISPAVDTRFAEDVGRLLSTGSWSAYYPIHDAEIAAATSARGHFAAKGIKVLAPDNAAIALTRDKSRLAEHFERHGVPIPETRMLRSAKWCGEHLHAKPRTGVGSHGAVKLSDEAALKRTQAWADAGEMIVQTFIPGTEITVDVFCSKPGELVAHCCRERLEVKAGVCTKARVFKDPVLKALASQVSHTVGLAGSFCFQVRGRSEVAEWQVIDVNPRVGGATPMSLAVGCDFASAHVALHCGIDPTQFFKPLPRDDVFVTRSYQEHVTWPQNPYLA